MPAHALGTLGIDGPDEDTINRSTHDSDVAISRGNLAQMLCKRDGKRFVATKT